MHDYFLAQYIRILPRSFNNRCRAMYSLRVRVDHTPAHFNILNFADAIELRVMSGGDCLVSSNDRRTHKLYHRDSCCHLLTISNQPHCLWIP
jgi:hypothetical protein